MFRSVSLCLAAAAMIATAAPGAADAAVRLRISTPAVPTDRHAEMLTVFKNELDKTAPGEFDVEIHTNATLFKQGTEPAAMQRGTLDMAMISAQDIAKQIPAWSVFTAGYLIRSPEHQQKVFRGEIGDHYYQMVADQMNIKILDVAYLGTRELNLRGDRKVETPADLKGVKLRMPGSDAWLFLGEALGANPTPMAFGEVYTGLQTGAIDGQDNPLPTVKAAKFYEVTNQIVMTDHLVDGVFLSMAMKTWDKLSDEQQQKVLAAARKATAYNNEKRIGDEKELVKFFEDQGLKVYKPDVEAFRQHVQEAYKNSKFAADWEDGIVNKINAVK